MGSCNILGVDFYPVTLQGACRTIDWMLSRDDCCVRVGVTANPLMVLAARKDPQLHLIMKKAHLLVPDGIGILWAAQKLGFSLPERVTGIDLALELLKTKPSSGFFFLGGRPGVAEKAKKEVMKINPEIKVLGTHHGYFSEQEEPAIVDEIAKSGASVLFACLGSPRQEKFIWRNRQNLGVKVAIGLGGTLDVLAGETKRAPLSFQKTGLEWLYRLINEPGRFWKDLFLLKFYFLIQIESLKNKGMKKETDQEEDKAVLGDNREDAK